MMSSFEMNRNLDFVEEVIRSVPEYVEAFQKVFDGEPNRERMAMAIAAFERTLVSVNTPLDRYLKGDKKALSAEAKKRLVIFTQKGQMRGMPFRVQPLGRQVLCLEVPENPEHQKDPRIAVTRRFVAKLDAFRGISYADRRPGAVPDHEG